MPLLRYGMTPVPQPGGQPGSYEEKLAQWLLEASFLRDFVHRNPPGKGGKGELADAVVLYGDLGILMQVKAKSSPRAFDVWGRSALGDALRQLKGTKRALFEGHVTELVGETLGPVSFDPSRYRSMFGLVILAADGPPCDPVSLAPELAHVQFPVHVLSLRDFVTVSSRFDTAGDFVIYLELREHVAALAPLLLNDEGSALRLLGEHTDDILRAVRPGYAPDVLARSAAALRRKATGELLQSDDWRYGLAVDDIIARLHERDESLSWNQTTSDADVMRVVEQLAWLTRDRRIELGRRLLAACDHAQDGDVHSFTHFRPSAGVAHVFLVSDLSRKDRVPALQAYCAAAQAKHDAPIVVGVATEPLGRGGRSYDVVFVEGRMPADVREFMQAGPITLGPTVPML